MKSKLQNVTLLVAFVTSASFFSFDAKAQEEKIAPTVIQMNPPVVVNFQQLADYEIGRAHV